MRQLDTLLRLNLEIDGALRTNAARHSDDALKLLEEKVAEFNTAFEDYVNSSDSQEDSESQLTSADDQFMLDNSATIKQDTQRVEDAIAGNIAKDITKAFTLNDKFRFLRGLFGNDQEDFNNTLHRLSAIESLDEAYDYLLNDREWDVDDEEVQAFISIIANHFNEA